MTASGAVFYFQQMAGQMSRAFKFLAPALLVATAVVSVSPSASSAAPHRVATAHTTTVHWTPCDKQFRCATIPVPIEYANPSLGSIKLAVVMLPSTGLHPIGDLFTNPGGPGASGVQFLEQNYTGFSARLRANFNLVSWDPRGVGASTPAVNCLNAAQIRRFTQITPDPTTPKQVHDVVAETQQFIAGCENKTPHLVLANVGTRTTIEDLDTLRADLGQQKLNYLGFSYGTYIGELYAQRYPTHIRTMVLDGTIDPSLGLTGSDREQALGFEGDLRAFFSWCNTNSACHKELPSGAKNEYDELFSKFAAGRVDTATFKSLYGGTQPVTFGVAELGVISTLYAKSQWPYLGQAIAQGLTDVEGNGNLLAEFAYQYAGLQSNGTFTNEQEANVAVNCLDSPSPRSLSFYETFAKQLSSVAPNFGASEAWGSLICAYWPYPAQGSPAPIHAPGTPKLLVVGSTNDPATPYVWAKTVAS
ncbi:MAG TPA: alpha/beta fold hydrolase, partial [Acidimicrobiales bacterium]|nr:alpha/beta fold hydrolase [Acidimicrobiales bacterium]